MIEKVRNMRPRIERHERKSFICKDDTRWNSLSNECPLYNEENSTNFHQLETNIPKFIFILSNKNIYSKQFQ